VLLGEPAQRQQYGLAERDADDGLLDRAGLVAVGKDADVGGPDRCSDSARSPVWTRSPAAATPPPNGSPPDGVHESPGRATPGRRFVTTA